MSRLEPALEPERSVRRVEVVTGVGGRRRWTIDDKAEIVAETLEPGASVSVVARRHDLTPQQLFAWRREARQRTVASEAPAPSFVPAVLEIPPPISKRPRGRQTLGAVSMELEIDGVVVRIGADAKPAAIAAVIRAVKSVS